MASQLLGIGSIRAIGTAKPMGANDQRNLFLLCIRDISNPIYPLPLILQFNFLLPVIINRKISNFYIFCAFLLNGAAAKTCSLNASAAPLVMPVWESRVRTAKAAIPAASLFLCFIDRPPYIHSIRIE